MKTNNATRTFVLGLFLSAAFAAFAEAADEPLVPAGKYHGFVNPYPPNGFPTPVPAVGFCGAEITHTEKVTEDFQPIYKVHVWQNKDYENEFESAVVADSEGKPRLFWEHSEADGLSGWSAEVTVPLNEKSRKPRSWTYTSVVWAFPFVFPGASYECLGLMKSPF